jgi:hypothetical protein
MLELAAAAAHTSGGTFFDAEELGFDEGLDERRAIDRDEGTVSAATELVDLTSDELLAGATLTFQRPVVDPSGFQSICRLIN